MTMPAKPVVRLPSARPVSSRMSLASVSM